MRQYELLFVADPRLSEEEVVGLSREYQGIIADGGGEILREESWGKRRLAYSIRKLTEGRYVLLHVQTDGEKNPFPLVEQRLRQNEKILRYLTVRTDRGAADPAAAAQPAGPAEGEA